MDINRMAAKLSESFGDAEVIAKTFMAQAVERSCDIGVNPVLTLTIMKTICEIGIEDYRQKFRKNHPLARVEQELDLFGELDKLVSSKIREGYAKYKEAR